MTASGMAILSGHAGAAGAQFPSETPYPPGAMPLDRPRAPRAGLLALAARPAHLHDQWCCPIPAAQAERTPWAKRRPPADLSAFLVPFGNPGSLSDVR